MREKDDELTPLEALLLLGLADREMTLEEIRFELETPAEETPGTDGRPRSH